MAIAVIGGLITSTLLTLVIVPAVFTLFDDIERSSAPKAFEDFGRGTSPAPDRNAPAPQARLNRRHSREGPTHRRTPSRRLAAAMLGIVGHCTGLPVSAVESAPLNAANSECLRCGRLRAYASAALPPLNYSVPLSEPLNGMPTAPRCRAPRLTRIIWRQKYNAVSHLSGRPTMPNKSSKCWPRRECHTLPRSCKCANSVPSGAYARSGWCSRFLRRHCPRAEMRRPWAAPSWRW